MMVSPRRPLEGEILIEQVGKSLTIIADDLRVTVEEFVEIVKKAVSAALPELVGKFPSPVGAIDFIAVIEECSRERCPAGSECRVDMRQVMAYCVGIEVVNDPPLSTRSGTFYLLAGAPDVEGDDPLLAFIGCRE